MSAPVSPVIEKLKVLRTRKDLVLKPTPHLKQTFTDYSGAERDLTIRYYQVQGILHLIFMKRFLLGDDTGLGKCCGFNTLVNTDRGLLRLGRLVDWSTMEPDTFHPMTYEVHALVGRKRCRIRNFYYGGLKPTIAVTTRYGFGVTGSRVHPLYVFRNGQHQWVQAQDLQQGDFLCVERQEHPFPKVEPVLAPHGPVKDMSTSLARFLGYYIGEGNLTAKGQIRLSQCPLKNPEIHADILHLLGTLFGRSPDYPERADLYLNDTRLRKWLAANGLDYVLSKDRVVPDCILQATRESNVEFLRALFEGEGHAGKTHIEYSTASEELGRQVQIMLLRFGVVARRAPKKVKGRDHVYWRLTICGDDARKFQAQIGFISSRKREALAACLDRHQNTNHDVVPNVQGVFEQVRGDLLRAVSKYGTNEDRKGSGLKQFGASLVNTLNNIRNYGRDPSYAFIQKVISLLERLDLEASSLPILRAFLDTMYFYDPIVSLEDGEEEVFDIEVDDPEHCFVGNGLINHNTVQAIGALCYLWEKDPTRKVIVLTTKSSAPQWVQEFARFTKGVRVIQATGSRQQRDAAYEAWRRGNKPTVMVMGYRSAVNDLRKLQDDHGYILITDEATVYKNPKTQVHKVVRHFSAQAERIWALTATLIKNHLMEGHGIFQVVVPGLFGNANSFQTYYCVIEMMQLRDGRKIPRIVSYYPEKIREFREVISPYYLGRPKHEVADELPALTREIIEVGVTAEQEAKYKEAMAGLLTVGSKKGEEIEKEVTKLTALIYHQEILDHPHLIDCTGDSEKLDALLDLLTEGDLADEKVIIFTRFSKMVDILMPALEKAGLHPVRVTGAEDGDTRQKAQNAFQNPNNPCKVICITSAGGEAINLQAAKAIVFYDTPWSAGEYLQVLGRMIRIGSIHDRVLAIHLVARVKGTPTVDQKVMTVLEKKLKLIEAVLGARLKGEGTPSEEPEMFEVVSEVAELYEALKADASKE